MIAVLQARGLHKRFGTTTALAGVDLHAAEGECVGLIGRNGGGRSTLLRLLATLLPPSAGSIEIDGLDAARQVHQVRRRLAYVGDVCAPGQGLTVREYLAFVLNVRRDPAQTRVSSDAVGDALKRAGLDASADVDKLSAGTRRRLSLTAAMLLKPRLLLLDDPFVGLDPDARLLFSVWLSEVRDSGTAVVAALNEDRDVRAICHRVVRLESGRITSPSLVTSDLEGVATVRTSAAI
jgi:ABC-2 type transport system ATP-binding protein